MKCGRGRPIDNLTSFFFRNLIVTSTGFSKDDKTELHQKVERMGGIYANSFHDGITHLVCSLVRLVVNF